MSEANALECEDCNDSTIGARCTRNRDASLVCTCSDDDENHVLKMLSGDDSQTRKTKEERQDRLPDARQAQFECSRSSKKQQFGDTEWVGC